jgi:hypothetical protein
MNAMRLSVELVELWSMTNISFLETSLLFCCDPPPLDGPLLKLV